MAKDYSELENDSQRLGWVLSELEQLIEAIELVQEEQGAMWNRKQWLASRIAQSKDTLGRQKELTQSLIGG